MTMPGRRWPRGVALAVRDLDNGKRPRTVARRHKMSARIVGILARRMALKRMQAEENAATAIEYALVASLIALAIFNVVGLTGNSVVSTFETVAAAL